MPSAPSLTAPICETCRKWNATWRASKTNGEAWDCCESCRQQGARLRVRGISYVTLAPPTTIDVAPEAVPDLLDEPRGYVGADHPETSHRMSAASLPKQGTVRRRIAEYVLQRGMASDDDLEVALERTHQSVSAARNGLVKDGLLADSGLTRANRHGNEAILWEPTRALASMGVNADA